MDTRALRSGLLAACLAAPACFYDAGTATTAVAPEASTGGDATTAVATTAAPITTGDAADASTDPTTTDPTAVDPSSPGDDTTTTNATTTDDATTTAPDATTTTTATTDDPDCAPFHEVLYVKDASIEPPMMTGDNDKEGVVAVSLEAEAGAVLFKVGLPCTDTYYLWGRVFDANPGMPADSDPDSYYASLDDGPEITWEYGCQTADAPLWSWQRVQLFDPNGCTLKDPWELALTAGTHHVKLRNREEASLFKQNAVARILVTNDPGYVPTNE